MRLLVVLSLLFSFSLATSQNWAIVIAGSSGYYNYRHQADAFHADKMLREHGFDQKHIITMMFDDIATHPSNPYRGNIINFPSGPNVYSSDVDYRGSTVTAANFLKILSGDKAGMTGIGSGKVVESTSDDNIFVFFSDHGAPGIISFPAGGYLHANDLVDTLTKMNSQKKYHEVLLYIEACESGSMFQNLLPSNLHVYAATAANPTESSWATYWDEERNAYLGDTFAVSFLEECDKGDLSTMTLGQMFARVRELTTESHAQQYGDMAITYETVGAFLLGRNTYRPIKTNVLMSAPPAAHYEQVSSRDIKLATLMRSFPKRLASPDAEAARAHMTEIETELVHRIRNDRHARALVHTLTGSGLHELQAERQNAPLRNPAKVLECLPDSIAVYESMCGTFSDYSMSHARTLAHLCEMGYDHEHISKAVERICR